VLDITQAEFDDKFDVSIRLMEDTGWVKHINIYDRKNNKKYEARLYWNYNEGYSMGWDNDAPPEAQRPDFEYVLGATMDGLTI